MMHAPTMRAAATPPFLTDDGPRPACDAPGVDPEWWFPLPGRINESVTKALTICHTCPLRMACADWAADTGQYGVWGGLTPGQLVQHRACRTGTCRRHAEHRWSNP